MNDTHIKQCSKVSDLSKLSKDANAGRTKEIRTNKYNNVDVFQLGCFCGSCISHVGESV